MKLVSFVTACAMCCSMNVPYCAKLLPKQYCRTARRVCITATAKPGSCTGSTNAPSATHAPEETPSAAPQPTTAPVQTPAASQVPSQKPTQTPEDTSKPVVSPTAAPTQKPTDSSLDEYALSVVEMVNEERQKQGLSALSIDENAAAAACVRADEIEQSFSHTRPNGESCFTVLKDLGIRYSGAGENIAKGQTTPERVMAAWMNSPGHYANIMKESFSRIGVCHKIIGGTHYWVQVFLK